MASDTQESDGVWVTYSYNMGSQIETVHRTEIEALRHAVNEGACAKVAFLKYGDRLN